MANEKGRIRGQADAQDAAPGAQGNGNPTPVDMSTALMKRSAFVMATEDNARFSEIAKILGVDDISKLEVISGGRIPFWPAIPGEVCAGQILGYREVPTQYRTANNPDGKVGLYTIQLIHGCTGATRQSLQDGEVYELKPGDRVSVLERSVLKELRMRVGQKVAILCVGKTHGAQFDYWDYRVVGVPRSPEEMQAAAQLVMAQQQTKAQLGSGAR